MKRLKKIRLQLTTETVRDLNTARALSDEQLKRVAGGDSSEACSTGTRTCNLN